MNTTAGASRHELARADRCRDQKLGFAALALADDRRGGEDHHVMLRITPISAGTICTAVRRSGCTRCGFEGLNGARSCRDAAAVAPSRAAGALSIMASLPSTRSCAAARSFCSRRARIRRDINPTLIRRRSDAGAARHARRRSRRRTTPAAPSSATRARDAGVGLVDDRCGMPRTSKLIAYPNSSICIGGRR